MLSRGLVRLYYCNSCSTVGSSDLRRSDPPPLQPGRIGHRRAARPTGEPRHRFLQHLPSDAAGNLIAFADGEVLAGGRDFGVWAGCCVVLKAARDEFGGGSCSFVACCLMLSKDHGSLLLTIKSLGRRLPYCNPIRQAMKAKATARAGWARAILLPKSVISLTHANVCKCQVNFNVMI